MCVCVSLYVFRCPSGFTTTLDGKRCIDLDECQNNPCFNDGICINHPGGKGFECHCPGQFAGPYCNALRVGRELNLSNAAVIMIIICVVNILSMLFVVVVGRGTVVSLCPVETRLQQHRSVSLVCPPVSIPMYPIWLCASDFPNFPNFFRD